LINKTSAVFNLLEELISKDGDVSWIFHKNAVARTHKSSIPEEDAVLANALDNSLLVGKAALAVGHSHDILHL